MKKVLFLGVFAVLGLASCKKDYTCACTSTVLGVSTTVTTTIKDKKNDAKTTCEKGSNSAAGITCAIK